MGIRIFIADDHTVFRSGLRALMGKESDFEVVGEAETGHGALRGLDETEVDVMVLDLTMPGGMTGFQIAEAALESHPRLAIVVLTMHEDSYYLRKMLEIGVRAFVLKKSKAQDLLRAIRAAHTGEHFVDPAMAGHLVDHFVGRQTEKRTGQLELLTNREQEVCQLLALGHTNAEVAQRLHISQRTVETHRTNIMSKLNLRNRADLVRFALDHDLLKLM